MMLTALGAGIGRVESAAAGAVEVSGVAIDTREMTGGELFVAIRGGRADGLDFVDEAVRLGASAVAADRHVETTVPVLRVRDGAEAAARLARRFYGEPDRDMTLAGVTGTNGKTSVCFLLRSILGGDRGPAGIIGTVGSGAGDHLDATTNTTPSPVETNRLLAGFRDAGCRSAVMEVSSHATIQKRIAGLEFDAAVYTNITRDHLDYHGTFENYRRAKELFARSLVGSDREKKPGVLVYNVDDRHVREIGEEFAGQTVSYGIERPADVRAAGLEADLEGTRFTIEAGTGETPVRLRLLGRFSAMNALAAAAAATALGIPPDAIRRGLEEAPAVPGRFQLVSRPGGPSIVVDYAHTPDALERVLGFCAELGAKRIVTVFGCGGDRDRGKRPEMGRIAARFSDEVVVTDDNPRTEDPAAIVADILEGLRGGSTPFEVVADRGEAIRRAVEGASAGEIVVIAGKGHEDYQIVGDERRHFSDVEEARRALRSTGKRDEAGGRDED